MVVLTLPLTGCDQTLSGDLADKLDYPYFGVSTDSSDAQSPYANKETYVLSEFDNKEVTVKQVDTYEEYDTAGPANYGITPDAQEAIEKSDEKADGTLETVSDDSSIAAKRDAIVNYAKQFLGKPYVFGGTWNGSTNYTATDCSGFVQGLYKHCGNLAITRTTITQSKYFKDANKWFKPSDTSVLRKGDLIYYSIGPIPTHVAMYIGDGKIIHASNRRDGIKITDNWQYKTVYGVARVWGSLPE